MIFRFSGCRIFTAGRDRAALNRKSQREALPRAFDCSVLALTQP